MLLHNTTQHLLDRKEITSVYVISELYSIAQLTWFTMHHMVFFMVSESYLAHCQTTMGKVFGGNS